MKNSINTLFTSINEYKKHINESFKVYHRLYSSAIDEITKYIDTVGYTYKEDDITNAYIDGFFKPKEGETKKDSIPLYKNGKEQKKMLHVQIYNMGKSGFELNMYIN